MSIPFKFRTWPHLTLTMPPWTDTVHALAMHMMTLHDPNMITVVSQELINVYRGVMTEMRSSYRIGAIYKVEAEPGEFPLNHASQVRSD